MTRSSGRPRRREIKEYDRGFKEGYDDFTALHNREYGVQGSRYWVNRNTGELMKVVGAGQVKPILESEHDYAEGYIDGYMRSHDDRT